MTPGTGIFIALCLICHLPGGASLQQYESKWQGTVEQRNGVSIVKNPEDPICSQAVFQLEEELVIGQAGGKEEYTFSRVAGMDVDAAGNIYVLDGASAHLRVFDKDGGYIRTIGRKGQGPGEFQMPVFVQATAQNEIVIYDYSSQRLTFFSPDGGYLRQVYAARTRYPVLPVRLDSRGNLIGIEVMAPPPLGGKELKKYGRNFEPLMVIAKEEQDLDDHRRGKMNVVKSTLYCAVSSNDNIVWGNSETYELQILNPAGELVRKISKVHKALKLTAEDEKKLRDRYSDFIRAGGKLDFPDHLPAFMALTVDDEGRIFVKTYERVDDQEGAFYFDVFDEEGRYIAKVPIEANLNQSSVWKGDRLYTIEEDEAGFQVIKRYQVKWKN